MTTPRLDFDGISIDKVPTVYPTLAEMMAPNDINSFINKPSVYDLGMKYGMIKIVAPKEFQDSIVNNLGDKETDPNFKIKIREQVLNELELSNRADKLFDKQLEAFDKISGIEHKVAGKVKVDEHGNEMSLYELYVKIMSTFNNEDVDTTGRYVTKSVKSGKRALAETTIDENQNNQKKRRSSRIKNTVNYNFNDVQEKEGNATSENKKLEQDATEQDWKVPDPKTCKFLQIPLKKGKVQPFTHSVKFWKSLGSNYAQIFFFYQQYLEKYLTALYKYEGTKPWSNQDSFKSNGISILHHITEEPVKYEENENEDVEEDTVDTCRICQKNKKLYQCEYCLEAYHKTCIPFISGKNGKLCDNCFIGNFEYGFQELEKRVTIKEFKEMSTANDIKNFNEERDLLNIEKEFWNIVYGKERIKSHYGADVHNDTENYISGFENQPSDNINNNFLNLMNLPNDQHTLLPLLNSITGISLPWCYFGSKFSVFGIHLEDHFTYSVNYQFAGNPKIWYCIQISDSDKFHQYITQKYPDFVKRQKDILHQLTVTISPYDKEMHERIGIKFYKACQKPFEYIITFPKCWHFGFNLGLNHNEAVNFILPNWIPYAIEADRVYRRDGRKNVFDVYKLIQKNMVINKDYSYKEELFKHVKKVVENINLAVEILMKEKITYEYKPRMLDVTEYKDSYMLNEITCDKCKKICSFATVLVYNDYELFYNKAFLNLKQILVFSKKINGAADGQDYENLDNYISNHSDSEHKGLYVYCVDCYNHHHQTYKNYLTTEIVCLEDDMNKNEIFKVDEQYGFPIDMK